MSFLDTIDKALSREMSPIDMVFLTILILVYCCLLGLLVISFACCFHFEFSFYSLVSSGILMKLFSHFKRKIKKFIKTHLKIDLTNYIHFKKFLKRLYSASVIVISISLFCYFFVDKTPQYAGELVAKYYPPAVVRMGDKFGELIASTDDTSVSSSVNVDNRHTDESNDNSLDYSDASRFRLLNINSKFDIIQMKNKFILKPNEAIVEGRLGYYLKDNCYDLFSSCDSSTNLNCDAELNIIALLETEFLNRIDLAAPYMESDVIKWYNMLPTSDDLDEIILLREDLVNRGYKCYTILNRLSNDYQEYAMEFYHLNKNPDAILYYYCKSIEADMQALSYATSRQEMNTCLRRIQMRYQDIYSCAIIDDAIREIAKSVSIQIAMDCGFDYSAIG